MLQIVGGIALILIGLIVLYGAIRGQRRTGDLATTMLAFGLSVLSIGGGIALIR